VTEPHKIWIERCEAARRIEDEFGTRQALKYLVGEKFLNFLQAAEDDPEFRVQIPAFVAEIKAMSRQQKESLTARKKPPAGGAGTCEGLEA
jgi:hypothetical protein